MAAGAYNRCTPERLANRVAMKFKPWMARSVVTCAMSVGLTGPLLARGPSAAAYRSAKSARITLMTIPARDLRGALPELRKLEPSTDQGPLQDLLVKVGDNVSRFFKTFPNVASDETVHQERIASIPYWDKFQTQSFNYLAEARPGQRLGDLNEFRGDASGRPLEVQGLENGFMLTAGFVSSSIVFATPYQSESQFRYLGRERVGEVETEVVAFAQSPSAREVELANVAGKPYKIFLQGVAWIDPVADQILELRSDLLQPIAEAGLDRQTTIIQYAPKKFSKLPLPLWLPRQVVVTVTVNQLTFRNVHTYANQRLFDVQVFDH